VGLGRQRNWPCYGRIRSKISRSRQTLTRDAPSHPKPFLCRGNIRVSFLWTTQGMKFLDEVRSGAEAVRQHGWEKCQTACKPGSVRPVLGRDDHSSGTHLTMRLTRPTRAARQERLRNNHIVTLQPPLFGLAPGGVYHAAPVARDAVRSCRTVSPLPAGQTCSRRPPCTGGLLSVALSLGSPPPAVSRHRVPVEPGLSSTGGIAPPAAAAQLSGKRDVRSRDQTVKHCLRSRRNSAGEPVCCGATP
jgi:hypothetical protein